MVCFRAMRRMCMEAGRSTLVAASPFETQSLGIVFSGSLQVSSST